MIKTKLKFWKRKKKSEQLDEKILTILIPLFELIRKRAQQIRESDTLSEEEKQKLLYFLAGKHYENDAPIHRVGEIDKSNNVKILVLKKG